MYKREFILKNGEPLLVREGIESDAEAAIAHLNTVGGESDFLTFGRTARAHARKRTRVSRGAA